MNLFNFLLLLIAHLICGLGLLGYFRIQQNPFIQKPMAIVLGIMIHSWVPTVLDMMHIPLTHGSVMNGILMTTLIFAGGLWVGRKELIQSIKEYRPRFHIYELPAILILAYILWLSAWRCYFFPVTPRDMLSGPETLATLALKEGTVFNSFFKMDLSTTNNHLKSPFMTGIQIIYKMFVQPFGQVWLIPIVWGFVTIMYTWMKENVHGVIAGLLTVLLVATPESFAYTFMALFDYSNMVLMTFGAYFLWRYLREQQMKFLWVSSFTFGMATYLRTESLILIAFMGGLLLWDWYRKKYPFTKVLINGAVLASVSLLMYLLVMNVYIKGFIPAKYDVSQNINPNLGDVSLFFKKFSDMNSELIFGQYAVMLWNYFIYFFLLLLALELIIFRKVNADGRFWLYAVLVVYVGLPFIGYLLPLADVMNTTKRGLFKILPLMLMYLRHNQLLVNASKGLWNWEQIAGTKETISKAVPKTAAAPIAKPQGKPKKK